VRVTADGLLHELEESGRTRGRMDGGGVRCWSDKSGRTVGGADGGRIDTPSQNIGLAGLRGRFGVQKDGGA
jgi:hypothetical protein